MTDLFNQAYDWIIAEFAGNDFLVGIALPAVIASLVLYLRTFAKLVYSYIVRNFTVTIRVNSDTYGFDQISQFVYDNYVWGIFRRNFTISYFYRTSDYAMTAGYGRSIAILNGCIGYVSREVEESDSETFKEYVVIQALTFFPQRLSKIIYAEIENELTKDAEKNVVTVYKSDSHGRRELVKKPKRSLDTIFIPDDQKSRIMGTLKNFIDSEEYYRKNAIPYHLGVILHGPPGTGKTSTIHAIASELDRDIHYHSNGPLANLEVDVKKTILVLEDFDRADFNSGSSSDDSGKSELANTIHGGLSDTLNYLDGFLTPHGLIVIATTNHLNTFDPAMIREGRFDLIEKIDKMGQNEFSKMCDYYDVQDVKYSENSGAQVMKAVKSRKK